MKTCGKILTTVMLILACAIAVNQAMAQGQVNQRPVVKGNPVTTDLGLNAPYPGMTATEIAKLEQMPSHNVVNVSETITVKPRETITDLGSGIPYQDLSRAEAEKLDQWQSSFTTSGEIGINPKMEMTTDEGAGRPYEGLNDAEKSKLEAMTSNSQ
jgi:hypothetical protein